MQLEGALLGLIYDAALDPGRWRDLGAILMEQFAAATHHVSIRDGSAQSIDTLTDHGFTDEAMAVYAAHYASGDVWVNGALSHPRNQALVGAQLIPDAELERSLWYNDFVKAYVAEPPFRLVGALVSLADDVTAVLGFHRPRHRPDYQADEVRAFDAVLPHLARAMQIRHRLGGQEAHTRASLAALHALAFGVLLIDRTGAVVFANQAAEAIARQDDGLTLARSGIGLGATNRQEQARLQRLIQSAIRPSRTAPGGGAMTVTRPSMRRPFRLLAAPLGANELVAGTHGSPVAIVFLSDPDQPPQSSADILASLFRLTPAEIRLVTRLIEGASLGEAAAAAGVSLNTVRTQLRTVFAKTGSNRQADLIRTVLSSPGYMTKRWW